ncbi:uncharacterized protein [Clytia hemisphaerica]|uniref:uncharacterized protein n=1 Tax=Clytia hemisphaerica TaxID=252671 RepID=UPI0034D50084
MRKLNVDRDYIMFNNVSAYSKRLMKYIDNMITIGAVSFEKLSEIVEGNWESNKINPDRIEEAWFIYRILEFMNVFPEWPRHTRMVKEIQGIIDTFKLQHDLNIVYDWTENNNMKLNSCKFEHLKYGKDTESKSLSTYFTNNKTIIENKNSVKDLGEWMSSDCSFTDHINKMIEKAKDISSWILRTFNNRSSDVMITLWKSLVLPHLDYCSQLWSPNSIHQIEQIESVQKNFFNKIKGLSAFDYWEQLKMLKMYSLQRRRERYRIIYIWSILEGIVPNFSHTEGDGTVKGGVSSSTTSRHGRKCELRTIERSSFRKFICESLAVQGPKLFNSIPSDIRNITGCSKDSFKKRLDKYLCSIPDEPHTTSRQTRLAESNALVHQIIRVGLNELDR